MPHLRTRLLGLLLLATVAVSAADAEPLFDADAKPLFAYGQWETHVMEQRNGPVRIDHATGKGGYGYNVDHDFSARSDHLLRLRLQVHDGNEARGLRVMLRDDDGTSGRFDFTLGVAGEVTLKPKDAAAVGEPNLITSDGADGELDVARITQVQVLGDWRDAPIDVTVLGVDVVPPDDADQELRADRRQRELEAQADLATRTQMALDAITRSEDSPQVVHVCTLAPNLLQLTIRAGTIAPVKLEPYVPQDGDEIRPNPQHEAVVWTEGQGKGQLAVEAERLELHRVVDSELRHVGFVSGDRTQMLPVERVAGDMLHPLLVDRPAGYVIVADDGTEFVPSAVHRKSKPINMTHPDRRAAMEHRVILELPEPLIVGASYEIGLPGVNTRRSVVPFDHDPREVRSDAVHATQIGYAPADPYKVAFLSTWLGTGGGLAYDVQQVELIDTAGRTVHTGTVEQVKALGAPEQLLEQRDYSQTAVYALDFSDFDRPGTYRVFVPGVGTSGPFAIGGTVWTDAFSVSMRGLLHHRSGIALGPPLTDYHRPRPHHPDDGVKIYPLETPGLDGEAQAVNREALTLLDRNLPEPHDGAWGGHMDAGDFDRNTRHLGMAHLLLELYELQPAFFADVALAVPADERANALPDLVDEALWTLDFFARLQRDDGGVGGGVEASAHPRDAETSWNESLFLGTFAPDAYASYSFAATAAVAARVVEPFDTDRAARYRAAAESAWAWAQLHADADRARFPKRAWQIDEQRALAAAELLHLTGAAEYDVVTGDLPEAAAFAYARLPDGVGDPQRKAAARATILELADRALAFGDANAFGISTPHPSIPMLGFVGYFSTPGTISRALPRAHHLTGDAKYLAGVIRSANFAAGANPDNLIYTTGLGWNAPRNPLHLDHRRTGQPAPAGITVYGPGDPAGGSSASEWMHTYFLADQMVPPSRTWPPQESFVDAFMWPEMAEYTIHQTIAPTAYTWGYLAAQASNPQASDN